jgi:hypothetical protein
MIQAPLLDLLQGAIRTVLLHGAQRRSTKNGTTAVMASVAEGNTLDGLHHGITQLSAHIAEKNTSFRRARESPRLGEKFHEAVTLTC